MQSKKRKTYNVKRIIVYNNKGFYKQCTLGSVLLLFLWSSMLFYLVYIVLYNTNGCNFNEIIRVYQNIHSIIIIIQK